MKANAPEKLYLSKNIYSTYLYQVPDPDDETAVEYTRSDAFIEKAEKYLKNQFINDVYIIAGGVVDINFSTAIKNFVNYMEGE